MRRILGTGLLLVALAAAARAETYYVATDGKAENDGSREKPWPSVEFALQKVGGGNTIVLRPGIYRDPIHIKHVHAGTEQRPTVIRSEVKWKAIILGAPGANISNEDNADWLKKDSPAIGKGSPEHAPLTDFWGRPAPKDKAPDLGAFAFEPSLLESEARAGWYLGWTYGFAPIRNAELPDLWTLPRASEPEKNPASSPPRGKP